MNFGQIPLVIGAMAILATLQLAVNSSIIRAYATSFEDEATIDAISIGQAMADEVNTKSFDKKTVTANAYWTTDLTPFVSFGPDSGEYVAPYDQDTSGYFHSQLVYNDFDDYHRYTRIVKSPRLGTFTVSDSVCYVQDSNKD